MPSRRVWVILAQVVALGAGAWFLLRKAVGSWGTITLTQLHIAWPPILAASVITSATYLYVVLLWVFSLRWWRERFPYLEAARVYFVSNLARFIPGMVWQLVGVAALSHERDVSPVAAAAAVLLQQVVLAFTGVAVTAAWAPALLARWAHGVQPGEMLGLAAGAMLLLVILLPRVMPLVARVVGRALRRTVTWPPMPTGEFAGYVAGLCLPWLTYGVAFWLFGRGLLGAQAPLFTLAVGSFVASYVAGLIVVFAPSGLVVREAALVAALAPAIGGGAALVLAVASRLWLLAVELITALGVLAAHALADRRQRAQ
jgi:hypothetical protein